MHKIFNSQRLIQDYQLVVRQEGRGRGNQTCSNTLVLFSMYTLEILGREVNLRGVLPILCYFMQIYRSTLHYLRVFNLNGVNVGTRRLQVELVAELKSLTNCSQDVLRALTALKHMASWVCMCGHGQG